uniref:Ras-GAP domain-containing protein n=1 Tax=Arcella intermedia TaxID=1963864 RepID=A0A6B2L299_9EUKA
MEHLVNICDTIPIGIQMYRKLIVRVAEGKGLPKSTGVRMDVYVEERLVGRTRLIESHNPFWGEEIEVDLADDELILEAILLKKKKSNHHSFQTSEIGRITLNLDNADKGENWYSIVNHKSRKKTVINIRMSISYEELILLTEDKFQKLLQILFDESTKYQIISILSKSTIPELPQLLCLISEKCCTTAKLLIDLLHRELYQTETTKETLFRGNSLSIQIMEHYMKLVGCYWLDCLNPVVKLVDSTASCEVRERCLHDNSTIEENFNNLKHIYEATTTAIFNSASQCPTQLKKIFFFLRKNTEEYFKDKSAGINAVTGFVFLRFFVPAVMAPKMFGLLTSYSSPHSETSFRLLATLLQKLANRQHFDTKDSHLDRFNEFLERDQKRLINFIKEICNYQENEPQRTEESPNIQPQIPFVLSRFCCCLNENVELLEEHLPDKWVVTFLSELSSITDEMKFLTKKWKTNQAKRRQEAEYQQTRKKSREGVPNLLSPKK